MTFSFHIKIQKNIFPYYNGPSISHVCKAGTLARFDPSSKDPQSSRAVYLYRDHNDKTCGWFDYLSRWKSRNQPVEFYSTHSRHLMDEDSQRKIITFFGHRICQKEFLLWSTRKRDREFWISLAFLPHSLFSMSASNFQ